MLGIISGLKRSTVGGIGKIYLGLLGSNLYSTPFTSCTIVFANSGSRFKRFKSIKRVQPSIGICRLLSSKTFTNASLLSLATKGTLSIIRLSRKVLIYSIALSLLPIRASHSAAIRYISGVDIAMLA